MLKAQAVCLVIVIVLSWTPKSYSQECVNGLMTSERVRQLGRVAGSLTNRLDQQSVIPEISFTCSGTVNKWIIAGDWKGGSNLLEVQVWREPFDDGVYTKIDSRTLGFDNEENSQVYEYTISGGSFAVQSGDILGIFQPTSSEIELYYTDSYGPTNYYMDTSSGGDDDDDRRRRATTAPSGDFNINGKSTRNDMPLITVEITPTDGSSASDCISSFATMDAIMAGLGQTLNDRGTQQRLIPGITFTCHGFITKWILAARWVNLNAFPELQTWNSTNDITYTKQGATTFSLEGGSTEMTFYEYTPDTPHEFHDGDIFGMYLPGIFRGRYRVFFEDIDTGPPNYFSLTGFTSTTPPAGDFSTTGVDTANEAPLIAVEVSIPPPESSVVVVPSSSVAAVNPSTTQQTQTTTTTMTSVVISPSVQPTDGVSQSSATRMDTSTAELSRVTSSEATTPPTSSSVQSLAPSSATQMGASTAEFSEVSSRGSPTSSSAQPLAPSSATQMGVSTTELSEMSSRVSSTSSSVQSIAPSSASQMGASTTELSEVSSRVSPTSSSAQSLAPSSASQMGASTTELFTRVSPSSSLENSAVGSSSASRVSTSVTEHPLVGTKAITTLEASSSPTASVALTRPVIGSSSSGSSAAPAAGVAMGIVAVVILVAIVTVVIAVKAVRRKRRKYDVQRHQHNNLGVVNPVYEAGTALQTVSFTREGEATLVKNDLYGASGIDAAVYEDLEQTMYSELSDTYAEPFSEVAASGNESYVPTEPKPDALVQSCYVPTEDQRKDYEDPEGIYAALATAVGNGEAETYFQESEIYWAPASNQSELYAQLARNKFREIPRPHIIVTDILGAGNFGQVNKGLWESSMGSMEVAVKMLRPTASETEKVKFLQEAAIMGQFHHPNVVTLHGVVTVVEPAMIVLELMPNGDLRTYLNQMIPIPGEMLPSNTNQMCLDFCCQIASGMEYLSKKAFIHRDLAARNVLVSDQRTCKIADFGMSRDLGTDDYYVSHGGKVPVRWTSPEALHYRKYSTASDVWSYGALMYEIWSLGHKPFEGYTNVQVVSLVNDGKRLPPPPGCPKAVYRLMVQCWHPETGSRPSFSDLLQSLSRPETELLSWTEEDTKTHPQATVLGGPLDAGTGLHTDLQSVYVKE